MTDSPVNEGRRKLLAAFAGGSLTALAGCSGGDSGGEPTPTDTPEPDTPTPTPTNTTTPSPDQGTPTPTDTSTPTPAGPDYVVPERFKQDEELLQQYTGFMESLEENQVQPGTFLSSLDINEFQQPEPNVDALEALTAVEFNDQTLEIVDQILGYGQDQRFQEPQARTVEGIQSGDEEYINAVLEGGLETNEVEETPSNVEFTGTETQFFGINGFYNEEHAADLEQILGNLSTDGYTSLEKQYIKQATKYTSEKKNGFQPRVQQAKNNEVWVSATENGEITEEQLNQFQDTDGDLLINAEDPSPGMITSSNDIYSDPITQNVLQGDPEEDYVLLMVDVASDVNNHEEAYEAIEYVGEKLAEQNINLIAIQGRTDIEPIESRDDLQDFAIKTRYPELNELASHYIMFSENVDDELTGINFRANDLDDPNYGYVDMTQRGPGPEKAAAHEIGAIVGGRDVPWLNKEDPRPEGEESFQSYNFGEMNRYVKGDVEAMRDNNFDIGSVESYGIFGSYDALEEMLAQGIRLDEEYDLIFASGTELETVSS